MKSLLCVFLLMAVAYGGDVVNYAPPSPPPPESDAQRIQRAINDHKVIIGMTAAQCLESWGKPYHINLTITATGKSEQWVYGSKYLYIEDGILTAIQN